MGGSSSKVTPLDLLEDSSKRPENLTQVTERLSSRIKELEQQLELKNEASKTTESQLESSQQQVCAPTVLTYHYPNIMCSYTSN